MRLNVLPILGPCVCRSILERDNCAACEGTGYRIDFAALHALPVADPVPVVYRVSVADGAPDPALVYARWQAGPAVRGLFGLPAMPDDEGGYWD